MKTRAIERIIEQAVERGAFPAAALLVAVDGGQPALHRAYGQATLQSVFDLASLTKPLATTALAMRLVADGRLDLEAPLSRYWPELVGRPLAEVTPTLLLAHCSGLPAWFPFYELIRARDLSFAAARRFVLQQVLRTPLESAPGTRAVYSDLGFIVLGALLERLGGARLHVLAKRELYRPLGLTHTCFVDLALPLARRPKLPFVPTERCPWRGERLCGTVHDDNTHTLGGVAGHAGLFASAYDVHILARELVAAEAGERSIFERDVVRHFWRARPLRSASWALGWDRPAADGKGSAGRLASPRCVGHLGFTGTSLWIDLSRRAWVVFLSNRVHAGREPNPMKRFRPRLHDAVWRSLSALLA